MSEPIFYVDTSAVRPGRLPEVKQAMHELAEFVDANEPQLVSYALYLDESKTHMSVVALHPDASSMELHMDVAGPAFRKFVGLIDLLRIDVYGRPTDKSLEQLQQKAQMLGSGTVRVHEWHAGLDRLGAART